MTLAVPEVLDTEIDFTLDDLPDVAATLHDLRAHKPAVWGKSFGRPTLALLTHELVQAAFIDEETFPAPAFYTQTVNEVQGRTLQCMTGDEHRINRALVSPSFRQRLMPSLALDLIEPLANELIDRFERSGCADLVAEFTARYPFLVITRLLGLPQHSEDEIRRWAVAMLDIGNHTEALRCSREFVTFVKPFLDQRRDNPEGDLLSTLATTEVEGHRLSDDEIFSFLRLLFPAGADTTYLGLGSTLYHLLTNPDQLELVLSDPGGQCRRAAEEGLRLDPPTAWIPRRCPSDMVWRGIPIPAGAAMLLGVMAANRDPAVFADPDRFDIGRTPGSVMTFGGGVHYCLGAHLARAEIDVALRVLLTRLPQLRLATSEGVRVTGTMHHLLRGPTSLPVRFD